MKQEEYEKLWGKKTMQEALQDAIAKAHTGYSYAKLVSMVGVLLLAYYNLLNSFLN